jgi:glyoxylase-like metal-dependent hydrolase (beta-lactamase superfamily II)
MLSEVGDRVYAYLQRDGGWGWSNSGLVVGDGGALVVDTLFDLNLTREMLAAYARVLGGTGIDVLVNSHANGDHCYGNELLGGARIVASRATAEELPEAPPEALAGMLRAAPNLGAVGEYLTRIFGSFQFDGITLTPPTETFDGELTLHAGGREVRLIEVGPAHTRGDTIVHLPDERLVFTADVLFAGGHPMVWAGPVTNWIRALDTVLALDADTVVPGHGPVTDRHGVEELRGYFTYLEREARQRHDAGLDPLAAALDISFADYASWGEAERIVVTIQALYSEWSGDEAPGRPQAFAAMAELDRRFREVRT